MPNKTNLPYPPGLGAEDRQLYSYLYKLIEQLNVCLEDIERRLREIENNTDDRR